MGAKPLVIVSEAIEEECLRWLGERCEVARVSPKDNGSIDGALDRAEGLIVRTYTRVDAGLLKRMPRLRVVGRAGVGLDNIDVEACRERDVQVVHTPDANTQAVAEFVLAIMLDAMRPRAYLESTPPPDAWRKQRESLVAQRELGDATLGIYGLGRIGSRVARLAAGVGMRVIYCDLIEMPERKRFGAEPVSREALLDESDVLSIHVDARPENHGLIDSEALSLVRDEVVLINTSRGFVVDAGALAAFLRAHPRAVALLDVHEPEPFGKDYPLLGLPNAWLTPHIAAATKSAHRQMSWVVRAVWEALDQPREAVQPGKVEKRA